MQRAVSSTSLIKNITEDNRLDVFKEDVFVAAICGIFPGKENDPEQDQKMIRVLTTYCKYYPVVYTSSISIEEMEIGCEDDYGYPLGQEEKNGEVDGEDGEPLFETTVIATLHHQEKSNPFTKGKPMLSSKMSFLVPKSKSLEYLETLKPLATEAMLNLLQAHSMTRRQLLTLFKPDSVQALPDYLSKKSYFIDNTLSGSDVCVDGGYQYEAKISGICIATGKSKKNAEDAKKEAYNDILANIQSSLSPQNETEFYVRIIACNMARNKLLTRETWNKITSQKILPALLEKLKDINKKGELANYRFVECLKEAGIIVSLKSLHKESMSALSVSDGSQGEEMNNRESPSSSSQDQSEEEDATPGKRFGGVPSDVSYAFKFIPPPAMLSPTNLFAENSASRAEQSDPTVKSSVSLVSQSSPPIVEQTRPYIC